MRRTERTAAEVPMMTRRMPSRSTRATMASLVACPHTQGEREREERVCARTARREREGANKERGRTGRGGVDELVNDVEKIHRDRGEGHATGRHGHCRERERA